MAREGLMDDTGEVFDTEYEAGYIEGYKQGMADREKTLMQNLRRTQFYTARTARKEALDKLVEKLEAIDPCDFASYTLCLIKEIVQDIKGE